MGRGVNNCTFIGNLGKDPDEMRSDNGSRTTFSMAINDEWKDKVTGEKKEKTEWVNFVVFGKLAEVMGKYVKKGDKLYIESKVQTRKFENDAGETKYYTEFMVKTFQFLTGGQDKAQGASTTHQGNQKEYQQGSPTSGNAMDDSGFDDDIPF